MVDEDWLEAGQPEPLAAEEYDGDDPCTYGGCEEPADYHVWFEATGSVRGSTLMCDGCSQDNRIWVRENDLLDREVPADA